MFYGNLIGSQRVYIKELKFWIRWIIRMFQESVAKFMKRVVRVATVTVTVSASVYGYLAYLSYNARAEFEAERQESGKLDFRVKGGDLVYLKHRCDKSFSAKHIAQCYTHKHYKWRVIRKNQIDLFRQSYYDSIGFVVDTEEGKRIMTLYYDEFLDLPIEEFSKLPFYSEIQLSQLNTDLENYGTQIDDFRIQIHHIQKVLEYSWPVRTSGIFRDSVDLAINLWVRLGFTKADLFRNFLRQTIGDIELANESYFKDGICSYSELKPISTYIQLPSIPSSSQSLHN
jgi:hypothetical protein